MKSIYENSLDVLSRTFKTGQTTPSEGNKENHIQPDQQCYIPQVKGQALNEKSLNTTVAQKIKDTSIPDLIEAIERIEEYQQTSLKDLRLKEAQEAKEKIIELKKELMLKKKQQLEERNQHQYEGLMEAQVKEMGDFNEFWDQRITDFEIEAGGIEAEMLERHKEEQIRVEEELRKMIPMKKKTSTQHLSYKKTFETLLKQKEYAEAEHFKILCDGLEREEQVKAYYEKEHRVNFFLGQLNHRHKNELNVLRKRITTGREELLKAKVIELEKLLHRFQNKKHQLELDQHLELSRFEVLTKNYMPFDPNASRSSCKGPVRPSTRHSKMALRIRDSSKTQMPNLSMMSPTNLFIDQQSQTSIVTSPIVKIGKHKRSYTNMGQGLNVIDVSVMAETPSNYKLKRANSFVKQ